MSDRQTQSEETWPVSWATARAAQLRAMSKTTPLQRLEWLEQALRLAHATGALSRAELPDDRRRRGLS